MRRALLAIGFFALVTLVVYSAWRRNWFSNAPIKWKVTVDEWEQVEHVDQDSIYCAANVSAIWGSICSLCRVERDSGKVLWRRKKSAKGAIWEKEQPFCWAGDTCFAGSHTFDRTSDKISNSRITAISLQSGDVLWEMPVTDEVRSLALGRALYCITNDGRFTIHDAKTGVKTTELDLHALAGPRASYGGIDVFGSVAVVGSNISTDYTNPRHAKVFLINLKTNRLFEELPKGELVDGKYVIHTGDEWQSFDLSADEPKGVTVNVPELSGPMPTEDYSGAVWARFTGPTWQLLGDDAKPMGAEFSHRLIHKAGDTLYLWDGRTLLSIDSRTGATAWSVRIAKGIWHVNASSLQVLVRGWGDIRGDTLHCFDANTGALQWKYNLNDQMGSSAWCEGREVIISDKGKLLYFDPRKQ